MYKSCASGIVLAIAASLWLSGCAELFEEFSTWPESELAGDSPIAAPGEGAGAPVSSSAPSEPTALVPQKPEIYKGTGRFVRSPRRPAVVSEDGSITLNFADTNIREVVRVVIGDILKQNYLIDPAVQGTVTIQTSRPLAQDALLPTLETLLQLNGAALLETGDVYKVVPLADAPRATQSLGVGTRRLPQGRGYGVQVVPIQFVSVSEMMKLLTPIVSETNILNVDRARNVILLGGTRNELAGILETINIFDVDWLAGMSFGYFPLEFADAKSIVTELQEILAQGDDSPLADVLRFVPIERLNALMVISPRAAYIDKVQAWIERLDRTGDQATARLFVYYVQNKRAADLADTLNQIFTGSAPTRRDTSRDRLRPGQRPVEVASRDRDERGSSASDGNTAGQGRQTQSQNTSGTQQSARATSSRRQRSADSSDAVTITEGRDVRIIADESNNALVILASPADYRMVESTLKKLDLVPLQVLLEATIAEVGLRDELEYGLQWFFQTGNNSFTLSDTAAALPASVFPGFSYVFSTNSAQVILNALDSITDVNMISSPQLMVLDNETAVLNVGDEVPIATQEAVSVTDADAPIVSEVQQRDTGVILTVTPRVNAGGLVVLEIEQEVSDVVETTTSGIDSPTIQVRKIETTVAVQSGETVALGGLIRESRDRTKAGIPILHELPIIGSLFGSSADLKERTELLVIITPRVVRSSAEARQVTDELRKRLRSVSPLDRKIR